MKYKAYPSYKENGVDGLIDVPKEWCLTRNKQAFSFVKNLVGENSSKYTLLSLTLKGIKVRDIESGKGKFPAEFNTYQEVHDKDLVFCLFDIDETPRTIGISSYKGMITGAYNVARCNAGTVPEFMYYYYLSIDEYKGLKPYYTGLRKVVRTETFLNIGFGLPSYQEQKSIANYLDKATSKIDTLIEKQTKLIELLKEKRQAVISSAVTRGLDASVPMKDSGVEWLGEIPEHWSRKKLASVALQKHNSFVDGPFGSDLKSKEYKTSGIPLIQLNNVKEGMHLVHKLKFISEGKKEELSRHIAKQGDIVIAKMADPVARATVVNDKFEEYVIVADCVRLTPDAKSINTAYLIYAINSRNVRIGAELVSTGTTRIRINLTELKKLWIPYPALKEQKTIAYYLDKKTSKIDNLITKSTQAITLLEEKRTALISAAVTGKIDVRDAA